MQLFVELSLRFENDLYIVGEGNFTLVNVLKFGLSSVPVTVNISSMETTASSNDFNFQPEAITFAADQYEQQISVFITSDTEVEGTEQLTLHLSTDQARVQIGNSTTINIQDAVGTT